MRRKLALFATAVCTIAAAAMAADQATLDQGRKVEKTTCIPCHSVRIIESQRLSRAAWDRELTKMTGWGWSAKSEERAAILEYLATSFGDDKQPAPPEKSADGRK
jgi:mono/diheme cytochrome c family protein